MRCIRVNAAVLFAPHARTSWLHTRLPAWHRSAMERRSTSARSARSRNCAVCGRASSWKSSACWRRPNALKESPDYKLHRLTTQTPAFFEEGLEKELGLLESEAEELAKEIEELTGEAATGIG